MKIHSLAAAIVALGGMLAASPSFAATPLRISLSADIRSTSPGINRDSNTDAIAAHIVEGLVAYGEDAQVRPMLADTVDVSDEGKTYTFKLRKGVKFHNGETLTSKDVLWTWKYYMNVANGWRCASDFDGRGAFNVTSVEAPDASTVVFRLKEPSGLFLSNLARSDCGVTGILHSSSVKADGSWDKPVGTGPFKLKEWKRGEYVALSRFADYSNRGGKLDGYTGSKRALVEEVRFMIIPDESTIKTALQRGDIDIIEDVSYSDVAIFKKDSNIKIATAPVMSVTGMLMQTLDPLLSNPKMRQAIAHAVDYAQVAAAVTENLAPANNSMVPVASPYYSAVQKQGWKYDTALSQKLLKEAGYKGQPITLIASKRYPQSYTSAVLAQSMLQSVGVNVKLEVMEWAALLDRYNAGKYQMLVMPFSARMDAALNYEMWTGDKTKQSRKVWNSPKAVELINQASLITEPEARQKIFDQLHRMFLEDVPSIPLYNGLDVGAMRTNIKGYQPWAVKKPRAWEVEKSGS